MKLLKILSLLVLLPLFCNAATLPETTPSSTKSVFFEKKWVKKLELRAQRALEKKGIVLDTAASNDATRSNIARAMGISSTALFIVCYLTLMGDGSGNPPDGIVALATVGVLVAFLMSVATFIVGRRLKNRKVKTGKIFAGVNLALVALLLLLVIIVWNSGE